MAAVLGDYFKTPERTIYWNDDLNKNVDPFSSLEGGFFAADWDFKVRVLRVKVFTPYTHTMFRSAQNITPACRIAIVP